MVATLELETVTTQTCPSCGTLHRFRTVLQPDESPECPTMLGFFTRCSNTGERIWLVVSVPTGKTGRMTELGPIDDDQWVPEVSFEPARAGRFERERSAAGGFGAVPGVRMRARPVGGALPKLLRLAWGCPY